MINPEPSDSGPQKQWLWRALLGLSFLLVLISLIAPLMNWPQTDESTYLLQARQIAQGLLPYRDFYDFVNPGSQFIGALFIRLNGFSLISIRLLVLTGWLLEILMLYTISKNHLPKPWVTLFVAFLWLTDSNYPIFQHHFWSGLIALSAVFMSWRYLQSLYNGKAQPRWIVWSSLLCAATFWFTQSLGILLTVALLLFSLLHCFLHERELQGTSYRHVKNRAVWARWLNEWGRFGALPWLGVHGVCIITLIKLGIWPDFLRDTLQWLAEGHYSQTSILGYYPTFHQEFLEAIKPFLDGLPWPVWLLFIFRFPIALHLFLIGVLPVLGILGLGYALPNRFHYRLLQRQDDELLLLWLCGTAMILSTMSYSTSMHITSNGGLAFLLGALTLVRFLSRRPRLEKRAQPLIVLFLSVLLLGAVTGSLTALAVGSWLSPTRTIPQPILYADPNTSGQQMVRLLNLLQEANHKQRSIFIFNESPSLYLVGGYQNATRFVLTIPQYTSSSQIAEIIQDLKKNKPLFIVDDMAMHFLLKDPRFAQYSASQLTIPALSHILSTDYQFQESYGRYGVFRRKQN